MKFKKEVILLLVFLYLLNFSYASFIDPITVNNPEFTLERVEPFVTLGRVFGINENGHPVEFGVEVTNNPGERSRILIGQVTYNLFIFLNRRKEEGIRI